MTDAERSDPKMRGLLSFARGRGLDEANVRQN